MSEKKTIHDLTALESIGYTSDFFMYPEHSLVLRCLERTSHPKHLIDKYWAFYNSGECKTVNEALPKLMRELSDGNKRAVILHAVAEGSGIYDPTEEIKAKGPKQLNEGGPK